VSSCSSDIGIAISVGVGEGRPLTVGVSGDVSGTSPFEMML